MLIPFPSPPALRKVPDHVFDHIAAAIDPPEVSVELNGFADNSRSNSRYYANTNNGLMVENQPEEEDVRVLREEGVGMYAVAVLEAGSAEALKRWMEVHRFRYPTGMDQVCDEYIQQGWCFVAVKTKVGRKLGADPQPGQREVNTRLTSCSTFDGHVQGMGFRFTTENLVVPMRLSAFNGGDLRNIVYLLTDGPRKIRNIPEEYVVLQLTGQQLYDNLTKQVPLRIFGGNHNDLLRNLNNGNLNYRINVPRNLNRRRFNNTNTVNNLNRFNNFNNRNAIVENRIRRNGRRVLQLARDPKQYNAQAKELFASDLLAVSSDRLSLPQEEIEKQLLNIGEGLGLRGPQMDLLHAETLAAEKEKVVAASLKSVQEMTLTVVDGDFPREVLANQNLTFAEYRMPVRLNSSRFYHAINKGRGAEQQGVSRFGKLESPATEEQLASQVNYTHWSSLLIGLAALVGLVAVGRLRQG